MEFVRTFQEKPVSQRRQMADQILKKHAPRLPFLVDRYRLTDPDMAHHKFLVEPDMLCSQFMHVLRGHIKLEPHQGLFVFARDTPLNMNQTMGQLYHTTADADGFMYLTYCLENTFGSHCQNIV